MRQQIMYNVNPDFDFTIDEKGNSFIALRKISWGENTTEKLDIRKYYNSADGTETLGKGISFLTDEGPNELAKVLVENNFGYTDDIINGIKNRKDFMTSLVKCVNGEDLSDLNVDLDKVEPEEEYYDPSSLLD
ncbi:MAG: hypothetical protein ACRDD7_17070 [Peptostreptococcaceae bacterium]